MRVDMKFPRLIRREGLLSVSKAEHRENSRLREMARVRVGAEDKAEKQGSVG